MWVRLGFVALMIMVLTHSDVYAQANSQFAYRITFRDKQGAPSVANAATFLSPRALQRRTHYGIAVDSTDRPVSHLYIDTVLSLTQGKLHNSSRWMNSCVILVTDSSKMALVRAKNYVTATEWVGYFGTGLHRDTDTAYSGNASNKGAGTQTFYNNSWNQTTMVNGDYLHDLGYMGQGILIALVDLGFLEADTHHGFDSLRNDNRIVDSWDFIRDTTDVYRYSDHGTAALSTMAGYLPNSYVGTAPKAQYALYITDDVGFTDALYELDNTIAGMERADSVGADIINASLGYNEFNSPYSFAYPKTDLDGKTTSVARAANMATSKGILVVAVAGNEGGNSWNFLLSPGDADSVLTIGAVGPTKVPAAFTSPGPNSAGHIKPDVCTQGDPALTFGSSNALVGKNGTSYSTPQIAGWAACLLQSHNGATPYQIRTAINQSADHYTAPTGRIGYGIPDFKKAYQSLGVVNVPDNQFTELIAYPNPVKNSCSVQLPTVRNTSYTVYDAEGRIVLDASVLLTTTKLNITLPQSMVSGVYTLVIQQGSKSFRARLLKN